MDNKLSPRHWRNLVADLRTAEAKLQSMDWNANDAAYTEAQANLDKAREALKFELMGAPLGSQGGNAFVTHGQGSKTLWIQGRPVADLERNWLELLSPETSERFYQNRKARQVTREKAYQVARAQLIADLKRSGHALLQSFEVWRYRSGQKGGAFENLRTGDRVAAQPAMRKAWGADWSEQVEEVFAADLTGGDYVRQLDRQVFGARY